MQPEPELFLTDTQNVRLPHTRPFLVCGDESRCPMGVWEDVLHRYRTEFQDELAGLLQQVARRHNGRQAEDRSASSLPSAEASELGKIRRDNAMAEFATERATMLTDGAPASSSVRPAAILADQLASTDSRRQDDANQRAAPAGAGGGRCGRCGVRVSAVCTRAVPSYPARAPGSTTSNLLLGTCSNADWGVGVVELFRLLESLRKSSWKSDRQTSPGGAYI